LKQGHPRLRDLERGVADPAAVADADLVIGHPFHGEVLAEMTGQEVVPAEELRPVLIGGTVIHIDGAMLATMANQIGLRITIHVQARYTTPARHRRLEDRGTRRAATPLHVLGQPYVHRQQPHHAYVSPPAPVVTSPTSSPLPTC